MADRTKKYWFIVVMGVLFLPLIQEVFAPFDQPKMEGVLKPLDEPQLTWKNWLSGDYQDSIETYKNRDVGFRNSLIKLNNQLFYSLFSEGRMYEVVVGKDQKLLLHKTILSFLGKDFIVADSIHELVEKTAYVQSKLAQKGILFAVVVVPNKSTYWADQIPDQFYALEKQTNNYEVFEQEFTKQSINILDFVPHLLATKDAQSIALYPKNGLHFGQYGQLLIADSIAQFLKAKSQRAFPKIIVTDLNISIVMQRDDEGLEKNMNIYTSLPDDPMTYPSFEVSPTSEATPKTMFVGDSYFMGLYELNLCSQLFGGGSFWYYNREIRDGLEKPIRYRKDVFILEEVLQHEMVVLFTSDANLYRYGFGFVDELYSALQNEKENRIQFYIKSINATPDWKEAIKIKAQEKNISLDEAIRIDAIYMVEQDSIQNINL